jgi:hypothetical protein
MADRKRKIRDEGDLLAVIEEELANDSDSDAEYGTIRINRGLPRDMIEEAKMLKKGEVTFRRKQNVLLLFLQDKCLVNMVSTLHTAAVVDNTSRRSGKTKRNTNALLIATHMNRADSADQ